MPTALRLTSSIGPNGRHHSKFWERPHELYYCIGRTYTYGAPLASMGISACSSPSSAPLAASARPYSSSCALPRPPVASFDQIRRGCCPPLAQLTPAASKSCNWPRHLASHLLPPLSSFESHTVPLFSTLYAPAGPRHLTSRRSSV